MIRVGSWSYLTKRPAVWDTLRADLGSQTFYLVNRNGPTLFTIRDNSANTFKVTLGGPHRCSCDSCSGYLCIHELFCLLKILRIDESHPLSYQLGFTDAETEQVLSGGCSSPVGRTGGELNRSAVARLKRQQSLAEKTKEDSVDHGYVPRQIVDDECADMCPICQDEVQRDQALTWCRRGCGNNMHAKCMQTFAQYKIVNKQTVVCPLCRAEWALEMLKDDCRGKATLKHSCSPIYCYSCLMPVRQGDFYRCVECTEGVCRAHREKSAHVALAERPITDSIDLLDLAAHVTLDLPIAPISRLTPAALQRQTPTPAAQTPKPKEKRARPFDFCTRCFPSVSRDHAMHHFVCSEAGTIAAADATWAPAANPLSQGALSAGYHQMLHQLEGRELTDQDYDLLLNLDARQEVNMSLGEHLVKAMPRWTYRKGRGASSTGRPRPGDQPQHPLLYALQAQDSQETRPGSRAGPSEQCWCEVGSIHRTESAARLGTGNELRVLPCGHAAHQMCICQALEHRIAMGYSAGSFKCQHVDCNEPAFPCLRRRRRKRADAEAGKDAERIGKVDEASLSPSLSTNLSSALSVSSALTMRSVSTAATNISTFGTTDRPGLARRTSIRPRTDRPIQLASFQGLTGQGIAFRAGGGGPISATRGGTAAQPGPPVGLLGLGGRTSPVEHLICPDMQIIGTARASSAALDKSDGSSAGSRRIPISRQRRSATPETLAPGATELQGMDFDKPQFTSSRGRLLKGPPKLAHRSISPIVKLPKLPVDVGLRTKSLSKMSADDHRAQDAKTAMELMALFAVMGQDTTEHGHTGQSVAGVIGTSSGPLRMPALMVEDIPHLSVPDLEPTSPSISAQFMRSVNELEMSNRDPSNSPDRTNTAWTDTMADEGMVDGQQSPFMRSRSPSPTHLSPHA